MSYRVLLNETAGCGECEVDGGKVRDKEVARDIPDD